MAGRRIYEQQLPKESDPEVLALASTWIAEARAAQRPMRAMAYAIPSTALGVILWGELYRFMGFDLHWYVTAGSAIVLGVLLGRPCRMLGTLFDRRWAVILGALGLVMAVLGDLQASILISAADAGTDWATVVGGLEPRQLGEWLAARAPIDWMVAGLAAAGAALAGRPPLDARQLAMEARIAICSQRLEQAEAEERAGAALEQRAS